MAKCEKRQRAERRNCRVITKAVHNLDEEILQVFFHYVMSYVLLLYAQSGLSTFSIFVAIANVQFFLLFFLME